MRESVLPRLKNDDFWEALYHLIIYKPQAFISGILAIEHLSKDGTLSYHNEGAQQLATVVNESQVQKIISMAVPKLVSEEQVLGLFDLFLRLGSDNKSNYYEYEVPLRITPEGRYDTYTTQGIGIVLSTSILQRHLEIGNIDRTTKHEMLKEMGKSCVLRGLITRPHFEERVQTNHLRGSIV